MKKIILCLSILATAVAVTHAQIQEMEKSMSQGLRTALVLNIPDVDPKNVGKLWQDFLKDNYKGRTKWNKKANEWVTEGADIAAIGMGRPVNLYAKADPLDKVGTTLSLWVDLGDAFLNSTNNPERFAEAQKLLDRFSMEAVKFKIGEELATQEKELKNMEAALKKLEKDKENAQKSIEKAREAIRKAEQEIEANEKEQKEATIKMEAQRRLVEDTQRRAKGF